VPAPRSGRGLGQAGGDRFKVHRPNLSPSRSSPHRQ
jgi:hypothetical protein